MSAIVVFAVLAALVAMFVKAVQYAVGGMPFWQADQQARLKPGAPRIARASA